MITLWRVLWTRYYEHFPHQVLNSWHHPSCVNSPPLASTTDSTSKSTTTAPYATSLISASLGAQTSSSSAIPKDDSDSTESPSVLSDGSGFSTSSSTSSLRSSTGVYRSSSTESELASAKKEESDEEIEEADEESDETQSKTLFNQKKKKCDCNKMSRCFHLIGFDLLMDEELNLHLLEVNNNPSMLCKASQLDSTIKQGVFESCLRLMGVLQDNQVKMVRNKTTLQFWDLSTGRPTPTAAPERICEELRPGVTFGQILKQVEPDLASVIDRL
eukprot:TRINITY_DN3312_c0_g1_i1.p1 TRINITY_DN3312_c0_g1~~TRINITY_DN3312_c0_g1_i1.p1  ORF type:complete len:273 (-),score=28.81 TRINITY_DN3312_c0_g1_i1:403-1221(-)